MNISGYEIEIFLCERTDGISGWRDLGTLSYGFYLTPVIGPRNFRYSSCIRQECGYCCIQYTPCADITGTDATSLDTMQATSVVQIDSLCSLDYIGIPGLSEKMFKILNGLYCTKCISRIERPVQPEHAPGNDVQQVLRGPLFDVGRWRRQ